MRRASVRGVLGRYIQGPVVTLLAICQVQVRPVPIRGLARARARRFAAPTRGFGQPTLDHGARRGEQCANQGSSLTHFWLGKVVQAGSAVK